MLPSMAVLAGLLAHCRSLGSGNVPAIKTDYHACVSVLRVPIEDLDRDSRPVYDAWLRLDCSARNAGVKCSVHDERLRVVEQMQGIASTWRIEDILRLRLQTAACVVKMEQWRPGPLPSGDCTTHGSEYGVGLAVDLLAKCDDWVTRFSQLGERVRAEANVIGSRTGQLLGELQMYCCNPAEPYDRALQACSSGHETIRDSISALRALVEEVAAFNARHQSPVH
eukprot:TRINITY_DN4936_c0_g1_i1.p1 TRINITY_DN4936_c0_g1~~TRINITY_DN4936_c0_g1_i1.p1  ORF type:complete len:224 (-),score=7.49 TRINITY_DN4936_c0_g1_i1:38-709(-)